MRDLSKGGGERGIRTPGGLTLNSFQDCRNRPLCHFSAAKIAKILYYYVVIIIFSLGKKPPLIDKIVPLIQSGLTLQ